MTFKEFEKRVANAREKRESVSDEINDLLRREAEIDEAMKAAAESDNVDLFFSLKREKEQLADMLYIKRSFLDKNANSVTVEDALKAWNDYAKSYNPKMRKALSDFNELKDKLLQAYSAMVDLQKEACAKREFLGGAVGMEESSFPMETIPVVSNLSPHSMLKLNGFQSGDPDACYYLAAHAEKNNVNLNSTIYQGIPANIDSELARITSVVLSHKSRQPFFDSIYR